MTIDAVVTDVDGVLLDTSDSYHRAIVESVRTVYGDTIPQTDIQAFKNAGGFNNDWQTADAIALFVLAQRHGYGGDVETFTDAIADRGGGIQSAEHVIRQSLDAATAKTIFDRWEPGELRRTFQWLYLGPQRYEEFEEAPPPAIRPEASGFMDDEPIIITEETRNDIEERYALGVLTGRPRIEAEIAFERIGISPPADRVITMDDWNGSKPEATGLVRIADAAQATDVVYVGDELDDVRTAVNAHEQDASRRYYGIGVLSGGLRGESGRTAFAEAGADAILDSINDLPSYLAEQH